MSPNPEVSRLVGGVFVVVFGLLEMPKVQCDLVVVMATRRPLSKPMNLFLEMSLAPHWLLLPLQRITLLPLAALVSRLHLGPHEQD